MTWRHPGSIGRNNFDFVRFALAVAVIFAHSYALLHGNDDGEPLMRATHGQITFGGLAVDWFFVISGFLIAHSWLRNPSKAEFLKKRVLRIYPGFIGAVLFSTFVIAPLASPLMRQHFIHELRPVKWLAYMMILQFHEPGYSSFPANPNHYINGSLWTIPFEFWCYIGVAILGSLALLKKRGLIVFLFVLALITSVLFLVKNWDAPHELLDRVALSPPLWARLAPYYLVGVLFYLFREQIPFARLPAIGCAIIMVAAAFIPVWGIALLLPLAGTYLLFWFAFEPRIRLENWVRFGDFSYGIYVFAFPIQQMVIMKMGTKISPLELFAISAPLTILAGVISWHLIERRFLKLKKKPLAEIEKTLVDKLVPSPEA